MTVGTKVVCIDGKFPDWIGKFYDQLPVKDQTYVIRAVMPGLNWKQEPEIAILLIGLVNPRSETPPNPERGFNIERFRPLDEVQAENRVGAGVSVSGKVEEEFTLVPVK